MLLKWIPAALLAVFFIGTGALPAAAAAAAAARAQWTPRVEARIANKTAPIPVGEVVVNGLVVMRLRTEMAGYLPEQRAEVAAERLQALVAAGLKPDDIIVDAATDKAFPRLKALGQVVATATEEEARKHGVTALRLVQSWASALKKALLLPGLSVSTERVVVPLGEKRVVRVGGAARGAITVASASGSANIVRFTPNPVTGNITLSGASVGKETLTLTREGATTTLTVAVQSYAGRVDAPRAITVTGRSVPADLIARYVVAGALSAARPSAGASAQVDAPTVSVVPLQAGQSQTVAVPLLLQGPDMIPVRKVARVAVTNRALPPAAPAALLYSNNPERVTRYGTLFAAYLTPSKGANRLLYHHQSAMDRAAQFTVELINEGSQPAQVHVIGGAAGPVRDTVWVGYRAASVFVRDLTEDVGVVVQVPGRSRIPLTAQRLAPGLTISGIAQLRQTTGKPLLVRVAADIPGDPRTATVELVSTPSPWEAGNLAALSDHVYPEPNKTLQASYQVGGRWAFASIGRTPIQGGTAERRLEGNYGVFYDIEFTLENPTDKASTAQIVFEPGAGLAGGIFLIDGRPVEIPQAGSRIEIPLARYPLAPGAKQVVRVRTLPLSGSNYPIRLTVRPPIVEERPVVTPEPVPVSSSGPGVGATNTVRP